MHIEHLTGFLVYAQPAEGTALGDSLLIGATTNALNTAGTSALSEKTWEKGIGHGVYDQPVTVAEIAESLRYYHRL